MLKKSASPRRRYPDVGSAHAIITLLFDRQMLLMVYHSSFLPFLRDSFLLRPQMPKRTTPRSGDDLITTIRHDIVTAPLVASDPMPTAQRERVAAQSPRGAGGLKLPEFLRATIVAVAAIAIGMVVQIQSGTAADDLDAQLNRMVDEEVVATGVKNPRVIAAMRATPRQDFIPSAERAKAFFDMAVPIGHGQSISPPFVVAYMTEQLDPQPTDKVLEVGTGSGYQAAVLSPLVAEVYTIEIKEPLGKTADATLARLGYKNVHRQIGDGYQGWPDAAPFDKIIVTCSPEKVPQPLVDQLREGGRLIVPVGERFQQTLYLFKKEKGQLVAQALEPTMFVPMTGAAERERVVKPDGARPALIGGGFEELAPDGHTPEGWYYLRQGAVHEDANAPAGQRVLLFTNEVAGRDARALQAFAIDGRVVPRLDLSLWVRLRNVERGVLREDEAGAAMAFYDEQRAMIGRPIRCGHWIGSADWHEETDSVPVPGRARMAILWIGLLGATGEAAFDKVAIVPRTANRSVPPQRKAAAKPD